VYKRQALPSFSKSLSKLIRIQVSWKRLKLLFLKKKES